MTIWKSDWEIKFRCGYSVFNIDPYCIKRIFHSRKTSETKQMSTQFFGPKNRLFPLFRHLVAMKSDFISFSWDFIAMRTVVIPYEDGRHTNEDGREGDEDGRHGDRALKNPWDIWSAVRFILLQAILRELRFITLPVFSPFYNQTARFWELSRHLILSGVSRTS